MFALGFVATIIGTLTDVFAAEPENRMAQEERGGGKTSVVGSPDVAGLDPGDRGR